MTTTTIAPPATTATAAPARGFARDTGTVLVRELRPLLHDPFSVVFGMVQPLVFLALFGPLLAGSVGPGVGAGLGAGPGGSVWQWFVPSILVMTTLFGTSITGSNLLFELQTGAHERMLVSPLSRPALLVGRALKEMAPVAGQAVVILAVMAPTSFELHALGALVGLALLAVLGVGIGALSYALAIAVRKQEWMFWAVQQTLLFPLLILSGMLLPLDAGPAWMRAVAQVNPVALVVDAERALFAGRLADTAVAWGWGAALATAAVGLAVGVRTVVRGTD